MFKIQSLIICFLITCTLNAQTYTTYKTVKGKTKKQFDKAQDLAFSRQYPLAIAELEKILKKDPTFIDAHIDWAEIKFDQRKYEESEIGFEKALAIDPTYSPQLPYKIGVTEMRLRKYDEAAVHLQQYLDGKPKSKRYVERAKKYLKQTSFAAEAIKNPVPFKPENLGANVNSASLDYFPSLTVDQQTLIYTVRLGDLQTGNEDFFMSQKVNGVWQKGVPLDGVNTPGNEGAQSISANGKILVFTACGRPDGKGNCDLYYAEKRNHQWTRPINMGAPINTKVGEKQPSISANGDELYFSRGTQGEMNLFVSRRQPNGKWGEPKALDKLNTSGAERTPFIHPDGQTLYFNSDGWTGMGGSDIFYVRKQADGTWSEPQNIGYPINTKLNEGFLVVGLDGKTAYFVSDRKDFPDAQGLMDIYSFELYEGARPQPVTYVKAKVTDAVTGKNLSAQVEFQDVKTSEMYVSSITDNEGEFLVCLPMGKDYALNVSKQKYLFHSENFALSAANSLDEPRVLDIALVPIPDKVTATASAVPTTSKAIILKNVFFETASAALKNESLSELNRLKKLLEENPNLNIQINGHTDNVGGDTGNLNLSENRAKAVYDFLIKNGIATNRLAYKGFGETQPIDSNETEEGRRNNRRTEFVVKR